MIKPLTDAEHAAIVPDIRDPSYGPAYYRALELDHGWSNELLGHVLWLLFRPGSAIDLGCGTGGTLAALREHGTKVLGLDASSACIPFAARRDPELAHRIVVHDLALPWESPLSVPRTLDLAVSIEMLEHVRPEGADVAVATICSCAPLAVVTACPPEASHGNPLHLNEEPWSRWVERFAAQGFLLDEAMTDALRKIMRTFADLAALPGQGIPTVPVWLYSGWIGVFRLCRSPGGWPR